MPHSRRTDAPAERAPRGRAAQGAASRGSGPQEGTSPTARDAAHEPRAEPVVAPKRERQARDRQASERQAREQEQALAALWLGVWQRIAGRAAHEVKNALNGVSVNLEVVRSRLARAAADPAAAPAATATRFAEVASAQLELLTVLSEALLALARPARAPADVAQLVAPLTVVLDAVARSEGGSLIAGGLAAGAASAAAAPPMAVRLVLAAALDAAVGRGRAVTCRVECGRAILVRIAWDGAHAAPALSREIVVAAADAGIGVDTAAHAVTLTFVPVPSGASAAAGATPAPAGDATLKSDP